MHCFNLKSEEKFDPKKHVERVLGRVAEGDVTIACWEQYLRIPPAPWREPSPDALAPPIGS